MGTIPVANPSPLRRPKVPRRGLRIAVLLFAFAVLAGTAVVFTWPIDSKVDRARWVTVGSLDHLTINEPLAVPERNLFLVRLESGEVLALWRRDPHLGCNVPWRPEFEFMGRNGWFRNPCHGQTYAVSGRCVAGPCIRGLDRFPVMIKDGEVRVDLQTIIPGPRVDTQARAGRDQLFPET